MDSVCSWLRFLKSTQDDRADVHFNNVHKFKASCRINKLINKTSLRAKHAKVASCLLRGAER